MTNLPAVVPEELGPGLVPTGFSESVLDRITALDDPRMLYDASAHLAGLAQKWNGHGKEKTEIKSAQMYCEVRLGQLLGPNPGDAAKGPGKSPHADFELPKQRINDFRRYYGHFNELVEAIREGNRSRRTLLLVVDRLQAKQRDADGKAPTVDELDIRAGDFREVLSDIRPGSVALVLTDPPYPEKYLPLWSDLGKWSAQWLAEGGSLVSYCGHAILPQALNALDEHLRYWWTFALIHSQSQMMVGKWVSAGWKPLVWYVRDHRGNNAMLADTLKGSAPRKTVPAGDDGTWAQGVQELEPIISGLTAPGDLIIDPFAGSGTTGLAATRFGRRFIGAELGM